jgi:ParB family chromosome partitioning protein
MKNEKKKKMVLGKGLEALIPGIESFNQPSSGEYFECDINRVFPNRYQPRQVFSESELEELSRSIRQQGIIQPLVARETESGYELIAGERRLRAAKMAGLATVPLVVKEVSDEELLEMSIIENIQRENLNPVEEADAYHQLMTRFDLTQEQAAERVGKSRPAVANILRLRNLPPEIKASISDGSITMGHARALLAAANPKQQIMAWNLVLSKKLSVRETEALMDRLKSGKKDTGPSSRTDSTSIYFNSLAEDLSRIFGTKVMFKRAGKGRGKVIFEYYTNDDLDRLLNIWNK